MFLCCSYFSFTGSGRHVPPNNAGNCQGHAAVVVDEWMSMKHWWNDNDKSKYTIEKLVPPFCPPKVQHEQTWNRTQAPTLKIWWPNALAKEWGHIPDVQKPQLHQSKKPICSSLMMFLAYQPIQHQTVIWQVRTRNWTGCGRQYLWLHLKCYTDTAGGSEAHHMET